MLRSVFLKSLRDQYRGLIGWSLGLGATVATMTALWPSIRDIPDLGKLLENYPESFQKLFDVDSIATGAGYLNTELFSVMLPALFIVFAVARGARLTVGEERAGTMEVLLVAPVPRIRVLLEKAAALGLSTVVLGVSLFVITAASSAVVGMGIAPGDLAGACVAMVLIGIDRIPRPGYRSRHGTTVAGDRDPRQHRRRGIRAVRHRAARGGGRALAGPLAVLPGDRGRAHRCGAPSQLPLAPGRRSGGDRRCPEALRSARRLRMKAGP